MKPEVQVLMYTMMLAERYRRPLRPGSLLYLKDGTQRAIHPKVYGSFTGLL